MCGGLVKVLQRPRTTGYNPAMALHSPMTFGRAAGVISASAVVCAAVGAGLGAAIGKFSPDYYRAVFSKSADLDQVSLGFGLGLTQGLAVGLILGVVITGILTWQHIRLSTRR